MFTANFFANSNRSLILNGKFNYNEAFAAFLRGTSQKIDTANVIKLFASKLSKFQVFTQNRAPLNVLDIGCADGSTGIQYLETIDYSAGFNYFGIDLNEQFIEDAKSALSNSAIIKKSTLIHGNAFDGCLKSRSELSSVTFDLIVVSHAAYYITDENACQNFVLDLANLLSPYGLAILLHENSFLNFRKKYSNFGLVDTPMLLAESSKALMFNQFNNIEFTSKLSFEQLTEDLWDALKYPKQYHTHCEQINFVDTLQKLAFIVQRDFTELQKEGRLTAFVNEAKKIIGENNNTYDITTHLQIIVSPQCLVLSAITSALEETDIELRKNPAFANSQ